MTSRFTSKINHLLSEVSLSQIQGIKLIQRRTTRMKLKKRKISILKAKKTELTTRRPMMKIWTNWMMITTMMMKVEITMTIWRNTSVMVSKRGQEMKRIAIRSGMRTMMKKMKDSQISYPSKTWLVTIRNRSLWTLPSTTTPSGNSTNNIPLTNFWKIINEWSVIKSLLNRKISYSEVVLWRKLETEHNKWFMKALDW